MNRINLWVVLLLVSVLINGVLIGMAAKRGLEADHKAHHATTDHTQRVRPGAFDPRRFLRALPEEYRAEVREQMRAARPEISSLYEDVRQSRAAVQEAMAAEPFDAVAVTQALDAARAARDRLERRGEAFMLEVAAGLPVEIRHQALVEASVRRDDDHGRRGGGRGPHDRQQDRSGPRPD